MTNLILQAARELGIQSTVRVLEDHQLNPLVSVVVGTHTVQSRIDVSWGMSGTTHIKTILSDMHDLASKN